MHPIFPLFESWRASCNACAQACAEAGKSLAGAGTGPATRARRARLAECVTSCQATLGLVRHDWAGHAEAFAACGDVCEACARALELPREMVDSAQACRACADACYAVWAAMVVADRVEDSLRRSWQTTPVRIACFSYAGD